MKNHEFYYNIFSLILSNASMSERLTHMSRVQEVESSNSRLVKSSYKALQMVRHRFDIDAMPIAAILPWRYDAEKGTANSLHALA